MDTQRALKRTIWSDTLKRLVTELKNKSDAVRTRAGRELSKFVSTMEREQKAEVFVALMADLTRNIFEMINGNTVQENLGAVTAIYELAEVDFRSHTVALARLADYLRIGLGSSDITVLNASARALGRLARLPITLVSDLCQAELKRALEALAQAVKEMKDAKQGQVEMKKTAALLILKALAADAPTMFYSSLPSFVELVWVGLRDAKQQIREIASDALGLALRLISERDNAEQWNRQIYAEANLALRSAVEGAIHGSLLCLGQLLLNSNEFMSSRAGEVCGILLRYKDNQNKLIKNAVISLLPRTAASNREEFTKVFLKTVMDFLLALLANGTDAERSAALIAVGELSVAIKKDTKPYLEAIIKEIQTTLTANSRRQSVNEALLSIGLLAEGVGPMLHRGVGMREFLDQIFAVELSQTLIKALEQLVTFLPTLLKEIQLRLINVLSTALRQQPFAVPDASGGVSKDLTRSKSKREAMGKRLSLGNVKRTAVITSGQPAEKKDKQSSSAAPVVVYEEEKAPETIALALKTLGTFNLTGYLSNIDEFLRDIAINFLEEENGAVRKEAAVAVSQLLVRICINPTKNTSTILLAEIIERLLVLGISDPDPTIRRTVLENLDPRLDSYLADAENLNSLFIALNDEEFAIRELAIVIIGRLALRNPAYVMPSLRRMLIQQLTELEFSGDSRIREESAKLLAASIRSSRQLIEPYVPAILKALLPKLDPSQDPKVRMEVLSALGELSATARDQMTPHIALLMPIVLDFLQDHASSIRREVALKVLGQLVQNCPKVHIVEQYPKLLELLMEIIKVEKTKPLRHLCLRVLGVMGAIDPYAYKQLLQKTTEEQSTSGEDQESDLAAQLADPSTSSYYPLVAIYALSSILSDSSLGAYHGKVINVIVQILKDCMGDQKITLILPVLMPPFLDVIRNADPSLMVVLFQNLVLLVSIVKTKSAIRPYLDSVFDIVQDAWQTSMLPQILVLIEELSISFGDEFKTYLPTLVPKMLSVLHPDNLELAPRILRNLEVIGSNLDDYLHLVVPAIVKLVSQTESDDVRLVAVTAIARLARILNVSEFASRIIHPLARLIQSESSLELKNGAMAAICHIVYQLGADYATFIPMVNRILTRHQLLHTPYEVLVSKLLKNQPLLESDLPPVGASEAVPVIKKGNIATEEIREVPKQINEAALKKVWGAGQQSTKDDWAEWMRTFSVAIVRESPEPAIRVCFELSQEYYPLVRSLFNAAFLSCWNALNKQARAEFIDNLRIALKSPHMPPEILQMWLNAAEFLEHARLPLPIELKELGRLASKCHAYAKALHYKELEFQTARTADNIESLISLNNQLQQPEAADGILRYAQENLSVDLKESWYEKLHRWDEALKVYQSRGSDPDAKLGKMRCLHALGEWDRLLDLCREMWTVTDSDGKREQIAPWAAAAACNLHAWESLSAYVQLIPADNAEASVFKALHALSRAESADSYAEVRKLIATTRDLVDTELTALVAESYSRAYEALVTVQILSEMEEVIDFKMYPERREFIRETWQSRLSHCQSSVQTWQRILAARSVVLLEEKSWLKFASLCRKSGALRLSHKVLVNLMGSDPSRQPLAPLPADKPHVTYQYIHQLWTAGAKDVAIQHLTKFEKSVTDSDTDLRAKCALTLGSWEFSMNEQNFTPQVAQHVLQYLQKSIDSSPSWYKAWHTWATCNFEFAGMFDKKKNKGAGAFSVSDQMTYVDAAVRGFFRSIALCSRNEGIQDTLRLLTLWFRHGGDKRIEIALQEGFNTVSIDTWLQVIPQIIARMDASNATVRTQINELLSRISKEHPQAIVYPLTLAAKSQVDAQQAMAQQMMNHLRQAADTAAMSTLEFDYSSSAMSLLDQAMTVSEELIRIAITKHEAWHEALEEASKLFFIEHNIDAMIRLLEPLHSAMEKVPETTLEASFYQLYGAPLAEAWSWCLQYAETGIKMCVLQAWDNYYQMFKSVSKQLEKMNTLDLKAVSPRLLSSKQLELSVPGMYEAGKPVTRIASFHPTLTVINSKQRPRKLRMKGSNGLEYAFLLKGHEDLRQDERVMQLFGLINNLLSNNQTTANRHLGIRRLSAVPLSPNTGLIGWVPHCDTLHQLIKEYRTLAEPKIPFNLEFKLLNHMSGDYNTLSVIQKIEVFKYTLSKTDGKDLQRIMWLKSPSSEVWLDQRTNFTRSLAVMSQAGYILGLGDRHPSNIMVDRATGHVVHIDFGDCFEVASLRDKFPEKVPFRLTRMLVNAMEASGIEGNFRTTCEQVMTVLRENRDSVMAVLEAFVYDPLINWRLLQTNNTDAHGDDPVDEKPGTPLENVREPDMDAEFVDGFTSKAKATATSKGSRRDLDAEDGINVTSDEADLNERALSVISRVNKKLTGRDFETDEDAIRRQALSVKEQVHKLIQQATSHENLAVLYQGWCSFW